MEIWPVEWLTEDLLKHEKNSETSKRAKSALQGAARAPFVQRSTISNLRLILLFPVLPLRVEW